ncbi:DUF427-domain-containing protein [Roridomyces roridus]|uniref:DUF427-domain-containing protein n=1 Tax=Roridomyces roridus TaxID=1738132 RepID=A0AAD7FY28_9AGAR|nr:DUF427-domain-containing protein [Roridomyces roridus]
MQATLAGTVLAQSDETIVVEGNHYFPNASVKLDFFNDSETHTVCPWKGTASYYHATVNGTTVKDIAWYYPETSEKAKNIKNYVAFYKNKVTIA